MSKAYESMRNVPAKDWPLGYFFVDSSHPRPAGTMSAVDRCEIHFCYPDKVSATLFLHVIDIRKRAPRGYTLFLFESERCDRTLVMIDADYFDESPTTATFSIAIFEAQMSSMAQLLAKFLHSIIAVHLLQGLPPKQGNGRPCPLWYVGFNGEKIKRIEELSGCGVRAMTTGIRQLISG